MMRRMGGPIEFTSEQSLLLGLMVFGLPVVLVICLLMAFSPQRVPGAGRQVVLWGLLVFLVFVSVVAVRVVNALE